MVNNPELINKMINNINKLDDETIKEAIQEVENEDMEEDIKILEERVKTLKRHIKNYEESDCKTNIYQQLVKECDATVNILHELKYNKIQFETQLREKLDLQASTIPISVIQNKIDELDRRIDYLNTELNKCYIEREKLGTETDIDNNETVIFCMEQEREYRYEQKQVLQELLEERR